MNAAADSLSTLVSLATTPQHSLTKVTVRRVTRSSVRGTDWSRSVRTRSAGKRPAGVHTSPTASTCVVYVLTLLSGV